LKESEFLLYDFDWLYHWFHHEDDETAKIKVHYLVRRFFDLESLICLCLENYDTAFISDILTPYAQEDTLAQDEEIAVMTALDQLYIDIHERVANAINAFEKEYQYYNLVGFFGTSAIIALSNSEDTGMKYPTFKESYGDLRNKEIRATLESNAIVQTTGIIISGECVPPSEF
jgi:hypothetical protein